MSETAAVTAAAGGRTLSLLPFLALARELAALLTPVRPDPQFRDILLDSLLAAARQRQAQERLLSPAVSLTPAFNLTARHWAIGAAAVGSVVSVAGLMAYFWRQRERRAA